MHLVIRAAPRTNDNTPQRPPGWCINLVINNNDN